MSCNKDSVTCTFVIVRFQRKSEKCYTVLHALWFIVTPLVHVHKCQKFSFLHFSQNCFARISHEIAELIVFITSEEKFL